MARMSREFSLVLLGAGVLTAGYFWFSEEEKLFAKEKEEEQKRQQVSSHRGHSHPGMFIFMHTGSYAGRGSPASPSGVARGGFGGIGAHTAGG